MIPCQAVLLLFAVRCILFLFLRTACQRIGWLLQKQFFQFKKFVANTRRARFFPFLLKDIISFPPLSKGMDFRFQTKDYALYNDSTHMVMGTRATPRVSFHHVTW